MLHNIVEVTIENSVAKFFLNSPETSNAINSELLKGLNKFLVPIGLDDKIRAVVITGRGKTFCAGGDLVKMSELPGGAVAGFYKLAAEFHKAIIEIYRMGKPVIAAINGPTVGAGLSLSLACDFRVMAKSAFLRQGYTSNGFSIDGGGTFMIPRLVGLGKAMEIVAFDKKISSEQALLWGLVTKVAEDDMVFEEAVNMAEALTKKSMNSFACSKKLLTDSLNTSLEEQLEKERNAVSGCAGHRDGKEGIEAFKQKRRPQFI